MKFMWFNLKSFAWRFDFYVTSSWFQSFSSASSCKAVGGSSDLVFDLRRTVAHKCLNSGQWCHVPIDWQSIEDTISRLNTESSTFVGNAYLDVTYRCVGKYAYEIAVRLVYLVCWRKAPPLKLRAHTVIMFSWFVLWTCERWISVLSVRTIIIVSDLNALFQNALMYDSSWN